MKIVYTLVIIGALALFALLLWWARGQVSVSSNTPKDSSNWYVQHPRHLAAENMRCWTLLRQTSFADIDKVMAAHPHCHAVYEAIQEQSGDNAG
ncbi:hypothetical protein HHS34_013755 [Acidithiobacillus montserratensis]|uniref:Uncharacterized protein n=1 Tax=Acidithiobacillus montserratensis TaxID=2729135 RepID=A0ACD5HF38_9PROT|nr:hypothetical protein [Acidithiobacillus montserratensis]MBN2679076.1 hypothetical protein [Acidithiobacillaceae bacterium]MBU2747023.1 hypothetical protein [Acidithiobacillus montserratensis]